MVSFKKMKRTRSPTSGASQPTMAKCVGCLWASNDVGLWHSYGPSSAQFYTQAVAKLEEGRRRPLTFDFAALDVAVRGHVFKRGKGNNDGDAAHMLNVVKWKLSRGQFRPGLLQMVEANSASALCAAMAAAYAAGPNVPAAIDALCTIKGIGPATATAILSQTDGIDCPFYADEAVVAALGLNAVKDVKYTVGAARQYVGAMAARKTELGKGSLTLVEMSHALWAYAVLN